MTLPFSLYPVQTFKIRHHIEDIEAGDNHAGKNH